MFNNMEYNKIILGVLTQVLFHKIPTSLYSNTFWLVRFYTADLLIFGISIQALILESNALWESHSALNLLPPEFLSVLVAEKSLKT